MKWLALLLLLLNGFYWYFESSRPVERPVSDPLPASSARLILMQELNFDELASLRLDSEPATSAGVKADMQVDEDPFDLIRQPASVESPESGESPLAGQCYLYDGSEPELRSIMERFDSLDIAHEMIEETTQTPGPMMVYVAPFETAREAAVEVSVLRSEGIDSFIIPDGELARGISVGVFGSEANAATRMAQLEALGYETNTYQYSVDEVVSRLLVSAVSAEVLADEFWAELNADFPDQQPTQISCIEVASQHNFQ